MVQPALDAFKIRWESTQPVFYAYYKKEWLCKSSLWISVYRGVDVPTTTGALEAYHGVIKLLFMNTRRRMANRRLDWLVYTILHRIVPYYVRHHVGNTRVADERDLMEFVHGRLREECASAAEVAQPGALVPARTSAARTAAAAQRGTAHREATLEKHAAQLLELVRQAAALGHGVEAHATALRAIKAAKISMGQLIAGTSVGGTLLPVAGDDHQQRRRPREFGGGLGSSPKRKKKVDSTPPVQQLLRNKQAGKQRKAKSVRQQLMGHGAAQRPPQCTPQCTPQRTPQRTPQPSPLQRTPPALPGASAPRATPVPREPNAAAAAPRVTPVHAAAPPPFALAAHRFVTPPPALGTMSAQQRWQLEKGRAAGKRARLDYGDEV